MAKNLKNVLVCAAAMLMLVSVLTVSAFATLGLTASEGWTWDEESKTLTLDNGAHHFINCSTEGTISGNAYAGGFAGWLYGRSSGCVANFDNCKAAVNILDNDYYGGGFIGNFTPSGTNLMTVKYTNCTASGDVFAKEPIGSFLDSDETTIDGIIGGTYSYDPENVDETTGETNNVAPGYRALDNGDGTWTVFPDLGREVVKIHFHRWNDETDSYENWRTVEVFKDVNFLNAAHNNLLNYSHPIYRFKDGDGDGIADGLAELNKDAGSVECPFTYWTDAPDGNGDEVLTNDTVIVGDMNVYVAYKVAEPVMDYEFHFQKGQASHICFLYVNRETGEIIYDHKIDFNDNDTYAVIPAKEGYISVVFVKQAQSGMVWAAEELDEDTVDAIVASVKKNDKSYKGHDAVCFGGGEHVLEFKKNKFVTYTFTGEEVDITEEPVIEESVTEEVAVEEPKKNNGNNKNKNKNKNK